jgi:hypothetical protein
VPSKSRRSASAGILRGTGVLATIGVVGLFGTVWGIINSFIGISKAHTTNLAVVAPGIAEALLATALGLAAAIHIRALDRGLSRGGWAMPRRRCCGWSVAISNAPPPFRPSGHRASRSPPVA